MIFENGILNLNLQLLHSVVSQPVANPTVLPFHLSRGEYGVFMQVTPKKILEEVSSYYESAEYTHITSLPGESNWGQVLGHAKLTYVRENCSLLDKSVLEIGGGVPWVGDSLLQKEGVTAYTLIDPAARDTDFQHKGKHIIKGYFPQDFAKNQKYDVIVCFGCISLISIIYQLYSKNA